MKHSIQNEATVFETIEKHDSVKKQLQLRKNKASIHLLLSNDFSCITRMRKFLAVYEPLLDHILEEAFINSGFQFAIEEVNGKFELRVKLEKPVKLTT